MTLRGARSMETTNRRPNLRKALKCLNRGRTQENRVSLVSRSPPRNAPGCAVRGTASLPMNEIGRTVKKFRERAR